LNSSVIHDCHFPKEASRIQLWNLHIDHDKPDYGI